MCERRSSPSAATPSAPPRARNITGVAVATPRWAGGALRCATTLTSGNSRPRPKPAGSSASATAHAVSSVLRTGNQCSTAARAMKPSFKPTDETAATRASDEPPRSAFPES